VAAGSRGVQSGGILATPEAVDASALRAARLATFLRIALGRPDVVERVRNTAARVDPLAYVIVRQATTEDPKFANLRRGLFIGAAATLLLIGASLLVSALEQLRERRRLLAMLVAFGTRRSTLGWSVLWQTAGPTLLGVGLAIVAGVGLGTLLLAMADEPLRLDWASIATMAGLGAAVVLLVTGLSMPALWRLMRPDGLRTE
jgi:ABC-type antimicrobial peptide transport system permease subunit